METTPNHNSALFGAVYSVSLMLLICWVFVKIIRKIFNIQSDRPDIITSLILFHLVPYGVNLWKFINNPNFDTFKNFSFISFSYQFFQFLMYLLILNMSIWGLILYWLIMLYANIIAVIFNMWNPIYLSYIWLAILLTFGYRKKLTIWYQSHKINKRKK